jgi:type IV pilus assembly protein PilV
MNSSGFALVEALVATVIVSISLLGMVQLILASLREGTEALTRTQAVTLIGDIAERIRANPGALGAYDTANYNGQPVERGCAASGTAARECSMRELAEDDLARWRVQAFDTVPQASAASVSFSSAADGRLAQYLIEVSWLQRGESQPTTLSAELQLAGGTPT